MTRLIAAIAALILAPLAVANASDVVAVCPAEFRLALGPWITHRQAEGLKVTVIPSASDWRLLATSIRSAASDSTRYVLLVGDAPVIGTACDIERQVPIGYRPTTVTSKWGSTPTLSSDLMYGDFDDDGLPEAVVGRLPVDHAGELQSLVTRILAYETSDDFGSWRSRVQLVGGVGGFGAIADAAIESVTRTVVTSVLPTQTRTHVAYGSPGHPFWPAGESFTDAVLDNYATGARFWVYAGHGQITELDRVPQTADGVPVLDRQSVQSLNRPHAAAPIALMLACYTGAIDAPEDSIAEQMLRCPGGPIAVFAGSRITMPYGNTTAAVGLIDGVFTKQLPRLGDAWIHSLAEMHREASADSNRTTARMMIDALATIVSPAGTDLKDERHEHMLLYNLIGDPTLQLHHPKRIEVAVGPSHLAGETISMDVSCPIAGQLRVCIDRPLGGVPSGDPNDTTIAEISMDVTQGQTCRPTFQLPADVHGPLLVRTHISGATTWASGAAQTILRKR